jgi:glycosyltransferase involved in cell wall biosynthesis
MRVIQVGKFFYPYMGGIENHLYVIARELRDAVEMEVLVSNTAPRTVREWVDGVSVTRCASLGTFASTPLSPGMPLELSRRAYDVVHLHMPNPMAAASYLASYKRKPHRLIVTHHGDVVRQRRLNALYGPVVDRLLARADVVLATSQNVLDVSPVLVPVKHKCRILPYGIDLDAFVRTPELEAEARELRARHGGRPVLLAVGRLIYYKGFEYAIRALALVPGADLVIVGDGPLRGELEQLARSLGVAERVTFTGDVHNHKMPPYFHASDIYLLPSVAVSEAFGIVQIEAMASSIPVINTSLKSGVPSVSRDGESGFTVEPANTEALAQAIQRLLGDTELRRRFGAEGRARAEREFSKQTLKRRLLEIYAGAGTGAGGASAGVP